MLKYVKLSLLSMAASFVIGNLNADLVLSSDAFADGQRIPAKYTCEGDNVSPALNWRNPVSGTTYYALTVSDRDAKNAGGHPFIHWVVANIPAGIGNLDEGVDLSTIDGVVVGENDFRNTKYDGPYPQDAGIHNYEFRLYALDGMLSVATGVNATDLLAAMVGHELENAVLVGTYSKTVSE